MGMFSFIGKAVEGVGDIFKGGSDSGGSQSNHDAAVDKVKLEFIAARVKALKAAGKNTKEASVQALSDFIAYMATAAYSTAVTQIEGQLNAGQGLTGTSIGSIVDNVLNSVVTGVTNGVQTGLSNSVGSAVTSGVNTVAQNLGANPQAATLQETIGTFLGGATDFAWKDFFKKNWYFFVLPFGLVAFLVFRGGSLFKRKTSSGAKRRTPTRRTKSKRWF